MRRGKKASTNGQRRGQIITMPFPFTTDLPRSSAARSKPGHWEGDLITGERKYAFYRYHRREVFPIPHSRQVKGKDALASSGL